MRWAQEQRLSFISEHLAEAGFVNRRHLVEKFRISTQQASLDLREFQLLYPAAMRYNNRSKRYERW